MQATDTVNSQDFARKAATVARWTGRALWFVFCATFRVAYALVLGAITFLLAFFNTSDAENETPVWSFGSGPGPAPGEPKHNHFRWNEYHHGED